MKIKNNAELKLLAHRCMRAILHDPKLKSVIAFASPLSDVRQRVKITRRKYKHKKAPENDLIVTFDCPNYRERKYLQLCKKEKTKPRRFWLKFFK